MKLGLALLWTGKMGFTHWDWDSATGNGMNNYKIKPSSEVDSTAVHNLAQRVVKG